MPFPGNLPDSLLQSLHNSVCTRMALEYEARIGRFDAHEIGAMLRGAAALGLIERAMEREYNEWVEKRGDGRTIFYEGKFYDLRGEIVSTTERPWRTRRAQRVVRPGK